MNRLQLPLAELGGPDVIARGPALNYLRDVLRLRPGSPIEIFDGEGHAWPSKVAEILEDGVRIELGTRVERPFTGVRVTLLQGLPKSDKLELIVQKAVELGATSLVPVAMERSIVKLDPKKAADRVERWQKIADEAARQSRRADTMRVEPVASFDQALARARIPGEIGLLLDEEETAKKLRDVLSSAEAHYSILIGPEGGVSRDEASAAIHAGYVPVSLGPRILRTETAGLAVLSVLQHVLGDLG